MLRKDAPSEQEWRAENHNRICEIEQCIRKHLLKDAATEFRPRVSKHRISGSEKKLYMDPKIPSPTDYAALILLASETGKTDSLLTGEIKRLRNAEKSLRASKKALSELTEEDRNTIDTGFILPDDDRRPKKLANYSLQKVGELIDDCADELENLANRYGELSTRADWHSIQIVLACRTVWNRYSQSPAPNDPGIRKFRDLGKVNIRASGQYGWFLIGVFRIFGLDGEKAQSASKHISKKSNLS